MRPTVFLVSFSLPLFTLGCSVPKYQPTTAAYRQAVVQGELKEALVSYEVQASLFPQQHWQAAVEAYAWAANTARAAGQLQKAITYGEKALEMAEKSKNPGSLFRAIDTLVLIYRQVRNFEG